MEKIINKFFEYLDEYLETLKNDKEVCIRKELIEESAFNPLISEISLNVAINSMANKDYITPEIREKLCKFPKFKEIFDAFETLEAFVDDIKERLDIENYDKENEFELFDALEVFSEVLLTSPLNSREKKEVLFIFLKQLNDGKVAKEIRNIKTFDVFEIIPSDIIEGNMQLEQLNYVRLFVNNLTAIDEKYFKKIDSYTKEDIDDIIKILKDIEVVPKLCGIVRTVLTKDLVAREKKEVKINIKPQTVNKNGVLTDQEYRTIRKELRKYFDFHNVKVIRELSEEEIIHCIELLIKIDTPICDINRFIYFTKMDDELYKEKNISLLEDKNPIALYVELYNKLKYYEKQLGSEKLIYIKECLEEMFICNDEEYEFYKQELEDELRKILVLIPQTYNYEITEIEKRIKNKKN